MIEKYFGRVLWIIMFEYLYKYKNEENGISKIKKFYWLVSDIMPCENCSQHFKMSMSINNIMSCKDWETLKNFTIWLYNEMHKEKISD